MTDAAPASAERAFPAPAHSSSLSSGMISSTQSFLSMDLLNSDDGDDDRIVWSVSESSISESSSSDAESSRVGLPSDDDGDNDFVVLSRPETSVGRSSAAVVRTGLSTPVEDDSQDFPRTPSMVDVELISQMRNLSMRDEALRSFYRLGGKKAKKPRMVVVMPQNLPTPQATPKRHRSKQAISARLNDVRASYPSPAPSPVRLPKVGHKYSDSLAPVGKVYGGGAAAASPTKARKNKKFASPYTKGHSFPIVDDMSERQSTAGDTESVGVPSMYEEAFTYISSYLSNPEAQANSICRLTLLQSLIIELGLATSSLPPSLSAAKSFLKSRAFLNIKEYLAVRNNGPEAVKSLLHPNKHALIKDIKRKGNRASLEWVKEHGLQVLLVSAFQ